MSVENARCVLVTGASGGIGKATALRLDREGFRVFAGFRSVQAGDALKREASERLIPVRLEVTDSASIAEAAETIAARLDGKGLDGLVNNAGIAAAGAIETISTSQDREQFEVNVLGLLETTRTFLPMIRKAGGRIVNVGSCVGRVAMPYLGTYSATKFAVAGLSDALRIELKPFHVAVSLIEPGVIRTPFWSVVEEAVARAILGALTSRRPKPYYRVGVDGRMLALLARITPAWMRDRMLGFQLGLK
jgi:NAD(P)-dependent dehydrogenase (short-subunit alcohol dehydrogenase family)